MFLVKHGHMQKSLALQAKRHNERTRHDSDGPPERRTAEELGDIFHRVFLQLTIKQQSLFQRVEQKRPMGF